MDTSKKEQHLEIASIVSGETLQGMVELSIDGKVIQRWDVAKAREICGMLHGAIEAAVSDEIIVKFMMTRMKLDKEHAVLVLRDFRELRQGSKETVYPM